VERIVVSLQKDIRTLYVACLAEREKEVRIYKTDGGLPNVRKHQPNSRNGLDNQKKKQNLGAVKKTHGLGQDDIGEGGIEECFCPSVWKRKGKSCEYDRELGPRLPLSKNDLGHEN